MADTPRVRAVVVNYDGGALAVECLHRLVDTRWPDLEVILVDNASRDAVVERVRRELPEIRVIESARNLGFAGGCNLALRGLAGVDHVALVNNDVTVEPGWLAPLVEALESDPGLGAACPKIRFSTPYAEVAIGSETRRRGRGDRRELGVLLRRVRAGGEDVTDRAQRVEGFWGFEPDGGQWTRDRALLRVPTARDRGSRTCELELMADQETAVTLGSGAAEARHTVGTAPSWYRAPLAGPPVEVINNAGSVVTAEGFGADRGWLERDLGQYDRPEDVFAWCGAAVLLRGAYLRDVGLLDERLFMYYEDLELSWRGARRGWRYRYVPASTVGHVHSATAVEGSRFARHYNERNRLLVLTRHAPPSRVARALGRYVLVTGSYARRDVLSPVLRANRPRPSLVADRLRALAGYLRLAPSVARDRRAVSTRH